jgi:AcrR family transcriptional regulator
LPQSRAPLGEILNAAFEELVKNGYAATRLQDGAQRAGVTKGTICFYVETKSGCSTK